MWKIDAYCYLSERILKVRVVMMWMLMLVCVLVTSIDPLNRLPWLALASALYILTFRLWDDLADLEYDRRHHPERCLSRSSEIQAFHTVLIFQISGLAGLFFFIAGGERAVFFIGLVVFFFVMYRATAKQTALRTLRISLVLVKYPAFVLLMAHYPADYITLLATLSAYLPPLLDETRSTGISVLMPAAALAGLAIFFWQTLIT